MSRYLACNFQTADPISDPSVLIIHVWSDEANVQSLKQLKFLTFKGKMVISHQWRYQIEIPSERMSPERSKGEISKFRNFRRYLRELTTLTLLGIN